MKIFIFNTKLNLKAEYCIAFSKNWILYLYFANLYKKKKTFIKF